MDSGFESYSFQHFITLVVFGVFTLFVIWIGMNANERLKMWIGYGIASASFAVMVFDLGLRWLTHRLDVRADLPLFLCDLVALILPVVILRQNRKWLGILYFWALAGTLQALVTPELKSGFPTFEFFRYFIMHGGIVTAVVYSVVVFKINITWRDLWNAVLYVQLYIVGVHIINVLLGSNYSYTMNKPGSVSILDLLGDWPWYLVFAELLMILLFVMLLVPFLVMGRNKRENPTMHASAQQDN